MTSGRNGFSESLRSLGVTTTKAIHVRLSNELVTLLSSQLYQSPLKAIEELVVNSYDAEAQRCRVFVPGGENGDAQVVLVYDDGIGMDADGLEALWLVGRSRKRSGDAEQRAKRKQIGKFGIGKLATYAIANSVTYITRSAAGVFAVTCNFNKFQEDSEGISPVELPVMRIHPWGKLTEVRVLGRACERAGVDLDWLVGKEGGRSWTIVLLERLKRRIQLGRLRWVLGSAMPLGSTFQLTLNQEVVASSKEEAETAVAFAIQDLPQKRLDSVNKTTCENWRVENSMLVGGSFPAGVSGKAIVAERSLHGGKSRDLGRSNGFFVRVRDRLINEDDALFGLPTLSHQTFNRFRADIAADDLDEVLTAQREGVGESQLKHALLPLLREVFYEARDRYEEWLDAEKKWQQKGKEQERTYVSPQLVEHPIADVLSAPGILRMGGAEADEGWFYLDVGDEKDVQALVASLNAPTRQRKYRYRYTNGGRTERLVTLDAKEGIFYLNSDHDVVREYGDEPGAQKLLEDFATSEALLEVYLREHGMLPHVVGEVLEKRDILLRRLANERRTSVGAIGRFLRESIEDGYDLEVALVEASRAVGFVAKHIGGAGQPDGMGRFRDYPGGERTIALEAKSSKGIPELSQLDFAGLAEHVKTVEADGCLLVAPGYPGGARENESAVAKRANESRVSCWTVGQLADVVEAAGTRHIGARDVLKIVLNCFAPGVVAAAVEKLLGDPTWDQRGLYGEIVRALQRLEGRLKDKIRTVEHVATEVSGVDAFASVLEEQVQDALRDLAAASQGGLVVRNGRVVANVSLKELERRVAALTRDGGAPRGGGSMFEGGTAE